MGAAAAAGRALQRRAARWLPALAEMVVARTTLARRVVPRDGLPALGWCDVGVRGASSGSGTSTSGGSDDGGAMASVYVCAAHSAITLAPLLGALVAAEVVDGVTCELIDPAWRPDRFVGSSRNSVSDKVRVPRPCAGQGAQFTSFRDHTQTTCARTHEKNKMHSCLSVVCLS